MPKFYCVVSSDSNIFSELHPLQSAFDKVLNLCTFSGIFLKHQTQLSKK